MIEILAFSFFQIQPRCGWENQVGMSVFNPTLACGANQIDSLQESCFGIIHLQSDRLKEKVIQTK